MLLIFCPIEILLPFSMRQSQHRKYIGEPRQIYRRSVNINREHKLHSELVYVELLFEYMYSSIRSHI
jgi:hypothetical protein